VSRPRLAVFKLASCDGCQLQLLNLEDELLALAERVEIAHFLEASSRVAPGPWDVVLVEGSVTTAHDAERIRGIRAQARYLVAIGACAVSGGIQALRNGADLAEWKRSVYPDPDRVEALPTSTPVSAHVAVDAELQGCPISREQLLRVLLRLLLGSTPDLPVASVCLECKRSGTACVVVTRGIPCNGPITRAGCGAICPGLGRDCYGCFGPSADPNVLGWAAQTERNGATRAEVLRRLRHVNGARRELRAAIEALEHAETAP
jgi:coenzyme F420-reducing hydrogenase gamma subunit